MNCRGVSGELVRMKGQVMCDIDIKGMIIQQRLLVVEGLVVPVILGMDFLSQLGEVVFDFKRGKLHVSYTGVDVDLLDGYETFNKKLNSVQAQVKETVTIPVLSKMCVVQS